MKLTLASLCLILFVGVVCCAWPPDKPVHRNKQPYKVVCYWGTWSFYRPGADGKFEAENINPNLCTHINYGFAKLVGNKIGLFDPDLDTGDEEWKSGLTWGHGMIRRVTELRHYNKNLAVMISIGGWNEGSNKYSAMASTAAGRKEFVHSVLEFLAKYEFDGLDVDWEYPSMEAAGDADRKPGREHDKQDYVALLKELHEAFAPHGYILTAAVSAGAPTIDRAYDVPQVSKYLDFINLMTYDFHGGWDNHTAHNAPLHPLPGATGVEKEFTVSYAVDHWIQKGADHKKLVLGIPLYGRTFTLANQAQNGLGAPVSGKGGEAGPITRLVGMLGYNEICSMVKHGWATHWNDQQHIPYATHANQWIGYDNVRSVGDKVHYVVEKKLGGGMIWTLDTDDFSGHCGEGKFPLLKVISKGLNHVDGPEVTIPHTHATPKPGTDPEQHVTLGAHTNAPHTQKPGTNTGSGTFHCTGTGFFKDTKDTHKFHQCVDVGNGKLKDYVFSCPTGTTYDENNHVCH